MKIKNMAASGLSGRIFYGTMNPTVARDIKPGDLLIDVEE